MPTNNWNTHRAVGFEVGFPFWSGTVVEDVAQFVAGEPVEAGVQGVQLRAPRPARW